MNPVLVSRSLPFVNWYSKTKYSPYCTAKSAAVARTVSSLNKNGYYIEVSGKIFDILKAKGVAIVNDEETVRKALKGKEIVWHGDGSYDRVIGGMKLRKVMMGKPKVT